MQRSQIHGESLILLVGNGDPESAGSDLDLEGALELEAQYIQLGSADGDPCGFGGNPLPSFGGRVDLEIQPALDLDTREGDECRGGGQLDLRLHRKPAGGGNRRSIHVEADLEDTELGVDSKSQS